MEKGSTNDDQMSKGKVLNNNLDYKINQIDSTSSDKLELIESYQDFFGGSSESNGGEKNHHNDLEKKDKNL